MMNLRMNLAEKKQLVRLNCYGVVCDIFGKDLQVLHNLQSDFSYFVSSNFFGRAHLEIMLHANTSPRFFKGRKVSWPGGTIVFDNTKLKSRRGHIVCGEDCYGYIVNYLHSVVGENLEKDGWFRMHACGFIEQGGAEIWMAQSGAGKSFRTLRALEGSQQCILGDEIIYFKNGFAYAFPVPIATAGNSNLSFRKRLFLGSEKTLIPIPISRVAAPTEKYKINYVGTSKLMFTVEFVLGLGLPQMRVYFVRMNNLSFLFKQFFARLKFAFGLNIQVASLQNLREKSSL